MRCLQEKGWKEQLLDIQVGACQRVVPVSPRASSPGGNGESSLDCHRDGAEVKMYIQSSSGERDSMTSKVVMFIRVVGKVGGASKQMSMMLNRPGLAPILPLGQYRLRMGDLSII